MPPARTLLLASRSPRRLSLLREYGYIVTNIDPHFCDPPQPPQGDPEKITQQLSARKAQSLWDHLDPAARQTAVILAADTIVIAPANQAHASPKNLSASPPPELLGQPLDRADAQRMLRLLLGQTHTVVTGVTLLDASTGRSDSFADSAQVTISPIPDSLLQAYLDAGHWTGKAGAYNLAELQSSWPIHVRGDPTTVVGLPMKKLVPRLEEHAIHPSQMTKPSRD